MGCDSIVASLWGGIDAEWWGARVFHLLYSQHGGSGLSLTYADIMNMPLDTILDMLSRLNERRDQERAALNRK